MEHVNTFKAALSAFCAALHRTVGLVWLAGHCLDPCMAIDYATGSCAALRAGKWSSQAARDGIWHKLGAVVAVIVAGILDMVISMILELCLA